MRQKIHSHLNAHAFILMIAAALVSGCSTTSSRPANSMFANNVSSPDSATTASMSDNYRIGAQDSLSIDVFETAEFTREVRVDNAGHFSMPFVGTFLAEGRTTAELEDEVEIELRRYIRNPIVTITVLEATSQTVTVDGAVTRPGVYPIARDTTLLQAVALAQGPSNVADVSIVTIIRRSGGNSAHEIFDLAAIRDGQVTDPYITADDVIVVGASATKTFLRDYGSAIPFLGGFGPF